MCRLVRLSLWVLLAWIACWPAVAADTESRAALVIGIGKYRFAPELPNPPNDAKAVADRLAALGFDVQLQLDLDNRGLASALRDFGIKAANADVAVIYYAGHGVQVDGQNYLIPADARLQRERDLLYEAIPLNLFLGEVSQSRQLGIMLLDACRDNPFVDRLVESIGARRNRAIGAGMSRIDDTPSDTLVGMATRANAVAEDGTGRHSPYTEALLKELEQPGLELSIFFRRVRDRVMQATEGRQEPYTFGSLGAKPFYFNPQPPNRDPVVSAAGPIQVLDNAGPTPLGIAQPSDPDNDRLVVQITGLPRGGSVRVGDRTVLIGDYLTVEQLRWTAFRPDGSLLGDAGAFEYMVTDGKGGSARGAVAVAIAASNRPPEMAPAIAVRAVLTRITVPPPVDRDGDPITITVKSLPDKGRVRTGGRTLAIGDTLEPAALADLRFDIEDAEIGYIGRMVLAAQDGKGGEATSTVTLEVIAPTAPVVVALDEEVWRQVKTSQRPDDYSSYIQLFPQGRFVPQARERLEALSAGEPRRESQPAPQTATPPPSVASAPTTAPEVSTAAREPTSPSDTAGQPQAARPTGPDLEPVTGSWEATVDANVRAEPSSNSARVARLTKGAPVRVLGRFPGTNWLQVELADGAKGYVYGDLVTQAAARTAEPPPAPSAPARPAETQVAAVPSTPPAGARTGGDGQSFRDCPECPVMMRVPSGSFVMGRDDAERSERPSRRVTIARPFALGKYEVTVAEWRACVEADGCPAMPRMFGKPVDTTPIHNIHHGDALAYARWLAQKTGQRYRLPSEAEWEYAAKGSTNSRYWWGERFDARYASCLECGVPIDRLTPIPVDAQPANPFGLYGMTGGVAEWVADCWFDDYARAPTDGSVRDVPGCSKRVLRGGSWRGRPENLTTTARFGYDQDVRYLENGFRVARDLN